MSNEQFEQPCKQQRFKGVENFLRRIAFNLGNTPSQTEVKIISCIPIDVTDLQQKIINLERELMETKVHAMTKLVKPMKKKSDTPLNISAALYGSTVVKPATTVSHCNINSVETEKSQKSIPRCCECLAGQNNSKVSFTLPIVPNQDPGPSCHFASSENTTSVNGKFGGTECYRSIFKKRKKRKILKDKKPKPQLVYYAQTPNHPFNNKMSANNKDNSHKDLDILSNAYLEEIFRKHHDPKLIVKEYSDTSHFSKPVCRDTAPNWKQPYSNASDVCSCCHGKFQNVDNYMHKFFTIESNNKKYTSDDICSKNYDLYDMIPVKETSLTYKKDSVLPNYDNYLNMKCWPEKIRTRYRHNPFIVNYELQVPTKMRVNKIDKNDLIKNGNPKSPNIKQNITKKTDIDTSKSCCIDCGDIYKKAVKSAPVKTFFCKNESVATDTVDMNIQLITPNTLTNVSVVDYNKTEVTLNQIKNILQSVLTEVKTNSSINNAPEKKAKKDAMIQKGTSQNNMQGASTLLHSFTYNNSYNGNSYLPSCSRQIHSGQYCYAGLPCEHGKCLNNFPVFIQSSPGRHMCACYYKSSAHKPTNRKRASSAATNTEKDLKVTNSKETEKLIKEIYKSIALNMEFSNKDNSASEFDDLKSSDNNSFTSDAKELVNTNIKRTEVSNVFKRDKEVEVLMSPLVSNTTESKSVNTSLSQSVSQNARLESKDQSINTGYKRTKTFHKLEDNSDELNDDSDESISSRESDYTVIPDEGNKVKKGKTGFLSKIFKSVKLFKKKKSQDQIEFEENSEASDSEDYETVYSEKIKTPPKFKSTSNRYAKRRPSFNTKYSRVKKTPTPYMEQEYRRQWNEQLMFNDNQNTRSASRKLPDRYNQRPTYWQEFEARSAMITETPKYKLVTPKKVGQQSNLNAETAIPKNKFSWLKKHKLGIHCGEHWKDLIREN